MDEEKKEKLIIEGNAIYEIDIECWNKKFGKKKEGEIKKKNKNQDGQR